MTAFCFKSPEGLPGATNKISVSKAALMGGFFCFSGFSLKIPQMEGVKSNA